MHPSRHRVLPTVQRILESMTGAPAFALNGRLDVLAANDLETSLNSLSEYATGDYA